MVTVNELGVTPVTSTSKLARIGVAGLTVLPLTGLVDVTAGE